MHLLGVRHFFRVSKRSWKRRFDYFIEEEIEAGIELTGTEIKSIRDGKCNIKDCYGIVRNGEVLSELEALSRRDYCVIYENGTMWTYSYKIKNPNRLTNCW